MSMDMPPLPHVPRLLTPREAAEILRVTPAQLLQYCRHGEISYIATGRGRKKMRRMFELEDLEKFIAARRRTEQWGSTAGKVRRFGTIGSKSVDTSFVARLKQRRSATLERSSASVGKPPRKN
jgi:Helix-turn-helix domain